MTDYLRLFAMLFLVSLLGPVARVDIARQSVTGGHTTDNYGHSKGPERRRPDQSHGSQDPAGVSGAYQWSDGRPRPSAEPRSSTIYRPKTRAASAEAACMCCADRLMVKRIDLV